MVGDLGVMRRCESVVGEGFRGLFGERIWWFSKFFENFLNFFKKFCKFFLAASVFMVKDFLRGEKSLLRGCS
jgi:hypothetical protein